MSRDLGTAPRCLLVWLAVTATTVAAGALLGPDAVATYRASSAFEPLLVATCEAALVAATGWLWLVTTIVLTDAVRGRGGSRRGIPERLRRLLLVTGGVALVGSLAAPSYADDASVLQGVPLPDRASTALHVAHLVERAAHPAPAPAAAPAPKRVAPEPAPARSVVVTPGDTLWALAAASLPPRAGNAAIADRVARLHRANRAVVGPDPDLIVPGQELRLPSRDL